MIFKFMPFSICVEEAKLFPMVPIKLFFLEEVKMFYGRSVTWSETDCQQGVE